VLSRAPGMSLFDPARGALGEGPGSACAYNPQACILAAEAAVVRAVPWLFELSEALVGGAEVAAAPEMIILAPAVVPGDSVIVHAEGDSGGTDFSQADKQAVRQANRDANGGKLRCERCGRDDLVDPKRAQGGQPRPANEGQVDHIVPKANGGQGVPGNGQVLCPACNAAKGVK